MRRTWIFYSVTVALLVQGFASSSIEKHGKRHEVHHQMKSKTRSSKGKSAETFLKNAPLGLGLGLRTNVAGLLGGLPVNNSKDVTTQSETTTKEDKGFKTITTVTKQIEKDKDNKTKVVGQSVESFTTNIKGLKPGKYKAGKFMKPKIILDLFNPFGFGLFADQPVKQCSDGKHCKKTGMFCDKVDWKCKKRAKLDERCDQAKQCEKDEKQHIACLWGTCSEITKATGYAGLFCEKNKDCGSKDLHCAPQPDISSFSNVCVYKPSEGQTCGRRSFLSFWSFRESHDLPCKKGLACLEVGFSGRKICRPESFRLKDELDDEHDDDDDDDDDNEDDDKEAKEEESSMT